MKVNLLCVLGHAVHGGRYNAGPHHQSPRHSVAHDSWPSHRVPSGQSVGQQGRDRRRDAIQRRCQRQEDLRSVA